MKVVFTGGGTGGHFYPIIAVAEQLNDIIDKENIADVELYYFADKPFDPELLKENSLKFVKIRAGKLRTYFSMENIADAISTGIGIIEAFFALFSIFPDVIFSKGGYVAFPTMVAAKILKIPVIIHESDSVPGRVNIWSSKFAKRIAISYKQDVDYFDAKKVVHTGQPIRADFESKITEGAHSFLELSPDIPTIWILGGSQGSQTINSVVSSTLKQLLPKYQIIHQTGENNYDTIKLLTEATLEDELYKNRYKIYPHLNYLSMKMAAGVSDIVISRAGSTIFEIANWRIPSIIIPLGSAHKNHQLKNAYNYSREGACTFIEENNLSDDQLIFEINRIYDNQEVKEKMIAGAIAFDIPDAAKKIAEEIASIGLTHEEEY